MTKEEWFEACLENDASVEIAEESWPHIEEMQKAIMKNMASYQMVAEATPEERLAIRQQAAEDGYEFTPSEVDHIADMIGGIMETL
jgi:hypothetical protein